MGDDQTMKLALSLFLSFCLSGCITAISYNKNEECALEELAVGQHDCEQPKDLEQKNEVERLKSAMVPKLNFNQEIDQKRILNGISYLFLWVGLGVYLYFNDKKSQAIRESEAIENEIKFLQQETALK